MRRKDITKQVPIYQRIRGIIEEARSRALYAVNTEMVQAYWLIGPGLLTVIGDYDIVKAL